MTKELQLLTLGGREGVCYKSLNYENVSKQIIFVGKQSNIRSSLALAKFSTKAPPTRPQRVGCRPLCHSQGRSERL